MKKIAALILAAVILCSFATALADGTPGVPGVPHVDNFAAMKTQTKGEIIYVTLSKPVDKLYANWLGDLQLVELAVTDDLRASVITTGHTYQLGVDWTDGYVRQPNPFSFRWIPAGSSEATNDAIIADSASYVDKYFPSLRAVRSTIDSRGWSYAWRMKGTSALASLSDRAYITLQGDWIVCYNRKGEIVDVVYANTGDVQNMRDVAFSK